MACHVGTSKYSCDAHTDIVLQLHEYMTHLRRSDVYGGMYLYVCVKYFFLIIWWLKIFNKCIFDVANVGRSLAFIGGDGFYKSIKAWQYFTGPGELS